jgi:hypothetical protein
MAFIPNASICTGINVHQHLVEDQLGPSEQYPTEVFMAIRIYIMIYWVITHVVWEVVTSV